MAASWKRWNVLAVCVLAALGITAVAEPSDTADEAPPAEAVDAQIRAMLPPATEPTMAPTADATTPYDPLRAPEENPRAWQYEELSPDEQLAADKGFDTSGWDKSQSVYAQAAAEQYLERARLHAQYMLGVTDLDTAGVVP